MCMYCICKPQTRLSVPSPISLLHSGKTLTLILCWEMNGGQRKCKENTPYTQTECHAPNLNSCCCICTGGENSYGYANVDIMYITGALASKPMQNTKRVRKGKRALPGKEIWVRWTSCYRSIMWPNFLPHHTQTGNTIWPPAQEQKPCLIFLCFIYTQTLFCKVEATTLTNIVDIAKNKNARGGKVGKLRLSGEPTRIVRYSEKWQ